MEMILSNLFLYWYEPLESYCAARKARPTFLLLPFRDLFLRLNPKNLVSITLLLHDRLFACLYTALDFCTSRLLSISYYFCRFCPPKQRRSSSANIWMLSGLNAAYGLAKGLQILQPDSTR